MSELVPYSIQGNSIKYDPSASFEAWELSVKGLETAARWGQKLLGEAVRFGKAKWPETYLQAISDLGYAPKTAANALRVVERVPVWDNDLDYDHHAVVASLEPEEQKRMLAMAKEEGLTTQEFRFRVSAKKGKSTLPDDFWLKKARKVLEWLRMNDPKESARIREWEVILAEFEGFSRRIDPES